MLLLHAYFQQFGIDRFGKFQLWRKADSKFTFVLHGLLEGEQVVSIGSAAAVAWAQVRF